MSAENLRISIDLPDQREKLISFVVRHKIHLIQNDDICKLELMSNVETRLRSIPCKNPVIPFYEKCIFFSGSRFLLNGLVNSKIEHDYCMKKNVTKKVGSILE